MPSFLSQPPPPLPTLPLFSVSPSKSPHHFLIGTRLRRKEENANAYEAHRGNPLSLVALAYDRRYPSRCTKILGIPTSESNCRLHKAEVKVLVRVGGWGRLPTREAGENLGFRKENGRMPTKDVVRPFGFVLENGEYPVKQTFDGVNVIKANSTFIPIEVEEPSHLVISSVEENDNFPNKRVENIHFAKGIEIFPLETEGQNPGLAEEKGLIPTKEGIEVVDPLGEDGRARVERHKVVNFFKENGWLPTKEEIGILHFDWRSGTLGANLSDLLIELVGDNELELAMNLISEISTYGISLDARSFSTMIQHLCKKNEPDKAKHVLDDMIRNGFHPNAGAFTHVIHCFCKRGRLQRAFEVFEIMNQIECEPTVRTYNCLINGLCYVGKVEEAFQLLKKIQISSKKPDIYTFTTVMDGFCKVGRSNEAMELLREALGTGLEPTVVTYNVLLNGYCREGRPLEGLSLLEEMEGRECKPDIISYSTLLQGLLKWRETSAALKVYKKTRESGFQVEERAMNTLLRGVCRQSMISKELLKEAHELIKRIREMDYTLTPYTYCLMVEALANGGEISKAMNYLLEMVKTGYSPRRMTCDVVIRILCKEGRVDDAMLVLVIMIRGSTIPSIFSFTTLLDEFNRQGRLLDSSGTYAAALKRGVILHQEPIKQF